MVGGRGSGARVDEAPNGAYPGWMPRRSRTFSVFLYLLKAAWVLFVLAMPLLGIWFASSLVAYRNGPVWATVFAGLLLFPIAPCAWELWARGRRARRPNARSPILTTADRIILRTLAINVTFVCMLLASYPQTGFIALSTRGDWMLASHSSPLAAKARRVLFDLAQRVEWLYVATHDNPYRKYDDGRDKAKPEPTKEPSPTPATGASGEASNPTALPFVAPAAPSWPMPATLHPLVTSIPAEDEKSIESVAHYIESHEPDPVGRVKALHDYVADRVAYDAVAYQNETYPPQDAPTVFATRRAVCAGYATLLAALGRQAGLDVIFVPGDARTDSDASGAHAWNAVRLDGKTYLIDATWDSGIVEGAKFTKGYRTTYLFTPPTVFGLDHFPDEPEWQLRPAPLSRGEFLRQPRLSPHFFESGLEFLEAPTTPLAARGGLHLELRNARRMGLMVDVTPERDATCTIAPAAPHPNPSIDCSFRKPGDYTLRLFAGPERMGAYEYAGSLTVHDE